MNNFFKKNLLSITVFITGSCVLIVEIVAVRVLSPYYGSTIFTVSSVISVILAALSIGYYIGGKLADKNPSKKFFFATIMFSGLLILGLHILGMILLPILSLFVSFIFGPLITALILFFVPALFLGTLSPYAIKLQTLDLPEVGIGTISGRIFFYSTIGSIFGSLLAGFFLVPYFGINYIFIVTSIVLFVLGVIPLLFFNLKKKTDFVQPLIFLLLFILITVFATHQYDKDYVYAKDGVYEKVIVHDSEEGGRPVRYLKLDKSHSGAVFLDSTDPTDLVFEYSKFYSLYKLFDLDVHNSLLIGGGAYSLARLMLNEFPEARVDVSEIESSLFEISKKYFYLEDDSRLHNYVVDGRQFLKESDRKYDFIFSDAYYSFYSIPVHLTTQEFFSLVKEKMSDGGVFMANIIGGLYTNEPSFLFSEINTFRSVFPNSYFFAVKSTEDENIQNFIFLAQNGDTQLTQSSFGEFSENLIDIDKYDLSQHQILTDDFAPIEYLMKGILKRSFVRWRE
jgi:spermidine synthase